MTGFNDVFVRTVHRMEGTETSMRWRTRLGFYVLLALVWAVLAIANFSRDATGMGWAWVALAGASASLAVFSWTRLRRNDRVS
ncbi:hypothetical protein GCU56_21670 [Geodermatophilus sabuli]|uniref:Uncharacterized protein n=1 Tax=Geodermatophilus sabuli TaxID=1564158 RepID=A0A7K3W6R1_9ACTN|nr:hypothetical protein [Geodermatophilus sabuli]NEK60471.1 hypothetical protein [Geodermatophilus sabuli]